MNVKAVSVIQPLVSARTVRAESAHASAKYSTGAGDRAVVPHRSSFCVPGVNVGSATSVGGSGATASTVKENGPDEDGVSPPLGSTATTLHVTVPDTPTEAPGV